MRVALASVELGSVASHLVSPLSADDRDMLLLVLSSFSFFLIADLQKPFCGFRAIQGCLLLHSISGKQVADPEHGQGSLFLVKTVLEVSALGSSVR